MILPEEYKVAVAKALLDDKKASGKPLHTYCKGLDIKPSIFLMITEGDLTAASDTLFFRIGSRFNINLQDLNWTTARTPVYVQMEQNLIFCKENSRAMILADDCGIGKTYCAKHICTKIPNTFYLNCAGCRTPSYFIRSLARVLGIDPSGRIVDLKESIKQCLNILPKPLVILDDAGYLKNETFIEIIDFWNATEKRVGWYMMGDDALQTKIERGKNNQTPGFKAVFNRFSEEYVRLMPLGKEDRTAYLKQLIGDVAHANVNNKDDVPKYIKSCMRDGKVLRNLETLIHNNA